MSALVPIVMFGWIPVVVGLFLLLPPRRAVIWAFFIAWLFLPIARYKTQGLPAYTKMSATCLGALLGAAIFDGQRLVRFRPGWIDVPLLIWSFCPFASSMSNGLGAYDGLSAAFEQTLTWGAPYFLGRVYFSDRVGLRELAVGIVIGGLVYVPLCLYEARMSPQLHRMFYGVYPRGIAGLREALRHGGYRPIVFMEHGLMVGMWMTAASVVGLWLWATGALQHLGRLPVGLLVMLLLGASGLCKSTGSLALLAVGIGVLLSAKFLRSRLPFLGLIALILAYMPTRATGVWSGRQLVSLSKELAGDARAFSIDARLREEDILAKRALQRPIFGWGGWRRNRPEGVGMATDGLWIIAFGMNGLVGLISLMGFLLLPVGVLLWCIPGRQLAQAHIAPAVALSMLLLLYAADNLFNAMVNPVFALTAGGLSGYVSMARSSLALSLGRPAAERAVLEPKEAQV